MIGEEDRLRNEGSSSLAASSSTNNPVPSAQQQRQQVIKSSSSTAATGHAQQQQSSSSSSGRNRHHIHRKHHRHRHKEDEGGGVSRSLASSPSSSEEEDRSKLELECQFAGIDIDPDIAELELDDDDNNYAENDNHEDGSGDDGCTVPSPPLGKRPSTSHSHSPHVSPTPGGTSRSESHQKFQTRGGSFGARGSSFGAGSANVENVEEEGEPSGPDKTVECTEVIVPIQTLAQKCLFYITAFFILLAVFSLFAFLFLVPFVIDPAFTTIFMEFDPEPAFCTTSEVIQLNGSSKCFWTSCREGCTREMFSCTQILINYRITDRDSAAAIFNNLGASMSSATTPAPPTRRRTKPHGKSSSAHHSSSSSSDHQHHPSGVSNIMIKKDAWWDKVHAHLYPNVKGCGYPPMVNCSVFFNQYGVKGTNFSCYYSKVNPSMVVTQYDLDRVIMDLVYSTAIPIPSFIISVIYLIFAYFRIYNTEPSGRRESQRREGGPRSGSRGEMVGSASTNNNIGAVNGGGDITSDKVEATKVPNANANARGMNQVFEMNDLNPMLHNPPDGDVFIPRISNRASERNGPSNMNPGHKNKGDEPPLLGGFEETDF